MKTEPQKRPLAEGISRFQSKIPPFLPCIAQDSGAGGSSSEHSIDAASISTVSCAPGTFRAPRQLQKSENQKKIPQQRAARAFHSTSPPESRAPPLPSIKAPPRYFPLQSLDARPSFRLDHPHHEKRFLPPPCAVDEFSSPSTRNSPRILFDGVFACLIDVNSRRFPNTYLNQSLCQALVCSSVLHTLTLSTLEV